MSRKGKTPIPLPKDVEISVSDERVAIRGPKGALTQDIMRGFLITKEADHLHICPERWRLRDKNFYGLTRALVANMVEGVSKGFVKKLELIGVGYRAAVQGTVLDVQIGRSHPTRLAIPSDLQVSVEKNSLVTISGIHKQQVGQFAANVRSLRKPEPYQGKGIRYQNEQVRRKAGKAAGKGKK